MLAVILFVLITYSTNIIHSIITTSKPQEIKYRKKAIDSSLGEPLTIWCSVSHPSTIISAYFIKANDKKGVSKVDGRLISSQNTTYTFHKPTVNDAAQWKCLLKTSTGEEGAYLDIYSRPILLNSNDSKVQYVYEGKDLSLNCIVKGHPKPVTKWTRKEIPIPYRNREYNITGSSLTLKNVHQDKGGTYTCTAINKFRVNGSERVYKTIMEHEIKVKSELGWILPLIIIIMTLITLVTVIIICEWRKRNNEMNCQEYE